MEIPRAALSSRPRTGPATGLGVDSGPATGFGADTGLVSGPGPDTGLVSGLGADPRLTAGRGEGSAQTTRVSRRPGRPVAPFPSNPSTPAYGSAMQTASGYGSAVTSAPEVDSTVASIPGYSVTVSSAPEYGVTVSSAPEYGVSVPSGPGFGSSVPSAPEYGVSVPSAPEYEASVPSAREYASSMPSTTGFGSAGPSTASRGSSGPSTTELELAPRRTTGPPASRRPQSRMRRSFVNHRVWGGALAVALVLVVPGVWQFRDLVTVTDGGLSGENANLALAEKKTGTKGSRVAKPDVAEPEVAETTSEGTAAERAQAKARTTAAALAAAAEKATIDASAKAPKNDTTKQTTNKKPVSGNTGRLTTAQSGLPWVSGVYSRGQGVGGVKAFGDWRGSAVDVAVDWPARQSWDDIVNPTWLYSTWQNTPYTKVFGVAPVPEGDDSATMAGCAAGSYNDKWREFAENIKAAGLDDKSVIRLGWEFNGDWYKWSANDPGQFAECWRQIVSSAEEVAPALLWDWTVNRGRGASVVDSRDAYPGDSYVDIIGVDSYDMFPGVKSDADWDKHYNGVFGLKFWSDFARAHGKKISIPEWGVYPGPASLGSNGGDNGFYIAKMQAFFKEQGSNLAYEAYFNEDMDYIASALFSPTQNPEAAAKYKSLFGG